MVPGDRPGRMDLSLHDSPSLGTCAFVVVTMSNISLARDSWAVIISESCSYQEILQGQNLAREEDHRAYALRLVISLSLAAILQVFRYKYTQRLSLHHHIHPGSLWTAS